VCIIWLSWLPSNACDALLTNAAMLSWNRDPRVISFGHDRG
jgi:hypothetical protein